ncbi:hypothetical protein [Methanobrevibacter sp.]|uniref:hypothetical protein n=1 Tax=Methanobrevibacter sp. TaxID=66852 RepID=UPI0025DD3DE4|nr:hypothetical protein [Methanobrevibacter sp.]MBQ6511377.1 hypothetical protein [Methanobrevibacter sp.]
MFKIYNYDIIPHILGNFKIKDIIISGVKDKNLIEAILSYNANYTLINTDKIKNFEVINGNPLNVLPSLNNYDAIFIDDDSNWYTIFTELNIIKNNNDDFPLIFICNNRFPNKRRDSYTNPNIIPKEFRKEFMKELPVCYNDEKITIFDGFYHACEENTSQNGVLTGIEDFLEENSHIGIMKINFIEDITILYNKLPINNKRIDIISKEINGSELNDLDLSSSIIENKLLISYINKNNVFNEKLNDYELEISDKTGLIKEYEEKIRIQDNEINYKDSKIDGFESKLNLKDTQIKSFESKLNLNNAKIKNFEDKLVNKDKTINKLQNELQDNNNRINEMATDLNEKESNFTKEKLDLDNQINSLRNDFDNQIDGLMSDFNKKECDFAKEKFILNNQLSLVNDEINSLRNDFSKKEDDFNNQLAEATSQINRKNKVIQQQKNQLEIINKQHTYQLSKSDRDKYCISCFKEEISNKHAEIDYLKNNTLTKKFLSPAGYLYLILKSNPRELSLNFRLLKALKNSKCFDIGFYLNNNPDIQKSKWCKYFSPELHYVCNGFKEERTFSKKYFDRNSKKRLLNYLLTCDNK